MNGQSNFLVTDSALRMSVRADGPYTRFVTRSKAALRKCYRKIALTPFLVLVLALAGCGEQQQTRQERLYGANAYRVAGDTTAWSNAPFNGDAGAWAHDIDERARNQNEYRRIR
ncbi:MAG TPA: hypothetical protein VEQ87_08055 [Burkholderiales bacterium]|nr:hypothetical protein [Burkholderiales bacterium]